MKQFILILTVFYISALWIGTAKAGGGLSGGATEFTQIANNAELITVRP
jgi:multisubunit Na+/H+ antiporter MnhB subunit